MSIAKDHAERMHAIGIPWNVVNDLPAMSDESCEIMERLSVGTLEGHGFDNQSFVRHFGPVVFNVLKSIEGILYPRIWYDTRSGFNHFAFDLDGSHYDLRYYKSFGVIKNHVDDHRFIKIINIQNENPIDKLIQLFSGQHKGWNPPKRSETQQDIINRYLTCHDDAPLHWSMDGVTYLGSIADSVPYWSIAIAPEGDPFPYIVRTQDNQIHAKALLFETAVDYALQVWDELDWE